MERKYKQRLPKEYELIELSFHGKFEQSYALGKHFKKDKYVFMQSDRKKIRYFIKSDLIVLVNMFIGNEVDPNQEQIKPESNEKLGIEVQ